LAGRVVSSMRSSLSSFVSPWFGRLLGVRVAVGLAVVAGVLGVGGSSALAVSPASHLSIHSLALPTNFSTADSAGCIAQEGFDKGETPPCDGFQLTVTNSGSVSDGEPVKITDTLPAGLKIVSVYLFWAKNRTINEENSVGEELYPFWDAEGEASTFCSTEALPERASCEFTSVVGELHPAQRLEMDVFVAVEEGAVSGENAASVLENGLVVGTASEDDSVSGVVPAFGPSALFSESLGVDGRSDLQAGDHPYDLSTRFDMSTVMGVSTDNEYAPTSVGGVRDVVADLPLGFVGSAVATPKCTFGELQGYPKGCPLDTLVGHITAEPKGLITVSGGIYNMVPEHGVVAEFGYKDLLHNTHVIVAMVAPTPSGYVTRAVAREVPQISLSNVTTTFYGDPGVKQEEVARLEGREPRAVTPSTMFTNSSDCSGEPLRTTLYMDSWQRPGAKNPDGSPDVDGPGWASVSSEEPPVTGCDELRFTPEAFSLQPDTVTADSASGLTFDLRVAQDEQPNTLATPPLRDATVTLPAGLISNPSAASGLTGCSEAQIGWLGPVGPGNAGLTNFSEAAPECPESSKIGTVEVHTPLLDGPLVGSMYVASQNENPFSTILAAYVVIDDPTTGVIVKIPGKLTLDPGTGQITGEFTESPQMPFSELRMRFFGGSRADLATPEGCGTYTSNGVLTPWSAPDSGPPASVSSSFQISSGCTPGFSPAFAAGTSSPQAAGYSPFTLTFSRQDSEQEISGLTVSLPPGLTAKIAGVAKCPEAAIQAAAAPSRTAAAEIAAPSCPATSEIGSVQASGGVGGEPLYIDTGKAYLTGPYKGAPLGIAVIVPVKAGPFDLGDVVVRTALYIDPSNAHVTAVSDPFPTIIDATGADGHTDGFPIRMRSITINLNRNTYILNPTSCSQMSINATFTSTTGTQAPAGLRFQVGGCRELAFKPVFTAATIGHASKANGASLTIHVKTTPGQANIAKVHTELPKQLPSWLPTLQKACLAKVFEANPAACPAASNVGVATAVSPLIATPFKGPAYLVSHGSAAFPDLEIVLQSEDITLILDGKTDIKHGITISNFETVPDAPVTNFELELPTGPNHVLATNVPEKLNHNLCSQKLTIPTLITAQNGATLKQTTNITITGCKPTKKHKTTKHKTTKKH